MLRKSTKQEKNAATRPTTAQAIIRPKKKWYQDINKDKVRKFLMGSKEKEGFIKMLVIYALLICIGFIYIYPILHVISTSFMSLNDLLDSSINWIPSTLNLSNYSSAAKSMDFWKSFGQSIILAGVPTICNLLSCSLVGYGIARFEFPGKKVVLGIILLSWVLPAQITMIPTYALYSKLNMIGTIWAFILPAILAQGLNAPIFILIFWQFFRQTPKVLIEAASIDGAGYLKSFFRISVPSAAPAYITVSLFSFVWYWNESYLTKLYVHGVLQTTGWTNLIVQLSNFESDYNQYSQTSSAGVASINESLSMAGTMLSILPLLVMYIFLQRFFVESIDNVGITGE